MKVDFDLNGELVVTGENGAEYAALRAWLAKFAAGDVAMFVSVKQPGVPVVDGEGVEQTPVMNTFYTVRGGTNPNKAPASMPVFQS